MNGNGDWSAVHRVRLGHVRKLLHHRYGTELPDDDAGAEDLRVLLHVKARCYRPDRRQKALLDEIDLIAPWLASNTAEQTAAEIAANPMKLKSDTLGRMLGLTSSTRERLRLWQIGAPDMDADWRRTRRRLRHAERMRQRRRAQGRMSRDEYRAAVSAGSAAATKPWVELGIARSSYYERKAKAKQAGISVAA